MEVMMIPYSEATVAEIVDNVPSMPATLAWSWGRFFGARQMAPSAATAISSSRLAILNRNSGAIKSTAMQKTARLS
jgi:hypothetical protein